MDHEGEVEKKQKNSGGYESGDRKTKSVSTREGRRMSIQKGKKKLGINKNTYV